MNLQIHALIKMLKAGYKLHGNIKLSNSFKLQKVQLLKYQLYFHNNLIQDLT